MPSEIIKECGIVLANNNLTIALAESASAGRLAYEFSLLPQSGKILKGGIVCYDATIKTTVLKIPQEHIHRFTPESAEITKELAQRLPSLIASDIQIAVTGLTTPGGSETAEKPVGTMFVCVVIKGRPIEIRKVFNGTPEEIVSQTVDMTAETIVKELSDNQVS